MNQSDESYFLEVSILSESTHQVQTLLAEVNNALHQLSPPIPVLVWGEGVTQSRQVLQQVQNYLQTSLDHSPPAVFNQSNSNDQATSACDDLRRELIDLQREVEELRQERHRLQAEIQQLHQQPPPVILENPLSSASVVAPAVSSSNLTDSLPPTTETSPPALESPEELYPQDYREVNEDLSDIFGELHFDPAASLKTIAAASSVEMNSSQILDAAIHLECPEPPLDGQEYILASPHENLLPVDQDEDQVDSLLLVGRGTLQRLESELMNLEDSQNRVEEETFQAEFELESESESDESFKEVPSFEELYAQFKQALPRWQDSSHSNPSTLEALLEQSHPNAIPSPPEVESLRLEALSREFEQSNLKKEYKKSDPC